MKYPHIVGFKEVLPKFFLFSAALISLVLIVFILAFYNIKWTHEDILESNETNLVQILEKIINEDLEHIESDLRFFAGEFEALHASDFLNKFELKKVLEQQYRIFSNEEKHYDQIRYIDSTGMEIIRINFKNDSAKLIPQSELQDKSKRYYFSDTYVLDRGKIFVSPLDLNIEHSKIEKPFKPMIRYGIPVFSKENRKIGVIILNYLAENLLNQIKSVGSESYGKVIMTNNDGYYIIGINQEEEWGFMIPERKDLSFSNKFPKQWCLIKGKDQGKLRVDDCFFNYISIYPLKEGSITSTGSKLANLPSKKMLNKDEYYWKIISFVDRDTFFAELTPHLNSWLVMLAVITLAIFILLWFLAQNIIRRKNVQFKLIRNAQELKELNASKDKFFSIIGHDLKNPIQEIILGAELMKLYSENKVYNKLILSTKKIISSAIGLGKLLENLLTWSNSQGGNIQFKPETFNLCEICQNVIELTEPSANKKGINIDHIKGGNILIHADRNQIETIIRNLSFNAIKFTPKGGNINISCKRNGSDVKLSVSDTGIGISEENIKKLFRIDTHHTTRGTQMENGTGLGLIICKDFVEQNGGTIECKSQVGKGSAFSITVPLNSNGSI